MVPRTSAGPGRSADRAALRPDGSLGAGTGEPA
jgi:hypothetical protein